MDPWIGVIGVVVGVLLKTLTDEWRDGRSEKRKAAREAREKRQAWMEEAFLLAGRSADGVTAALQGLAVTYDLETLGKRGDTFQRLSMVIRLHLPELEDEFEQFRGAIEAGAGAVMSDPANTNAPQHLIAINGACARLTTRLRDLSLEQFGPPA